MVTAYCQHCALVPGGCCWGTGGGECHSQPALWVFWGEGRWEEGREGAQLGGRKSRLDPCVGMVVEMAADSAIVSYSPKSGDPTQDSLVRHPHKGGSRFEYTHWGCRGVREHLSLTLRRPAARSPVVASASQSGESWATTLGSTGLEGSAAYGSFKR